MLNPSRESSAATLAELRPLSLSPVHEKFIDDRLVLDLAPQRVNLPDGWTLYSHPSGWVYFVHIEHNIVTDDDIRDPDTLASLTAQLDSLPVIPPACEVHMHAKSLLRTYVNHDRALGGWELEAVDGSRVDTMDASSLLRLRRMYWAFLQQHPCHVPLPPGAEDDLVDALTTFRTENLMFDHLSPSPFLDSELDSLFNVLKTHQSTSSRHQSPAKTAFVAWLLRRIYSYRESASHSRHTRKFYDELLLQKQTGDVVVSAAERRQGVLWLFLNLILEFIMTIGLWSVPYSYLRHVRSAIQYRGRLSAVKNRWESYVRKLVEDWNGFNLVGTVLLSATVSFLAVPGIDEVSAILCMYSILLSLGSVVIGVFCVWKHQTNVRAGDSFRYMQNAQNSFFGLRGLAILQSLPLIMLIWAILCFAGAIVMYAFRAQPEDSSEGEPLRGRILVSQSVTAGAILVFSTVAIAVWAFARIWETRSSVGLLTRIVSTIRPSRTEWH
ncbi:hypothetical protein EXIGLDRAFT_716272 [Exidia glandulosa HHB12029]|uniref:WW domain-containing protein n=1 Tax=Exidia glandulosa HHB12029 TaxID=1314781 RepID=A0A165QZS9_EXIGL|nr:hypothetical protein EXIGLDRAFT_716272 [Exidia glandulosa HHB12029]